MKIFNSVTGFKGVRPVLTIGTFDGVHLGHQKILERLREAAGEIKGEATLLTFDPHPRMVLYPEQTDLRLLTTKEEKSDLLRQFGVDNLIFQPFTHEFSRIPYDEFVKKIIAEGIRPEKVVIGYDHHFGHNREGGLKQLQLLSGAYGFKVEEIPEEDINYAAVSSTRVRKALMAGDIRSANRLLGHPYCITGKVVEGKKLGRQLGFPTANLETDPVKLIPALGIYAVKVVAESREYQGMLSIGNRPTFDNGPTTIEVNILDFSGNLYGRTITLYLHHFLRNEEKFGSTDDLIAQMEKDKLQTLELFS